MDRMFLRYLGVVGLFCLLALSSALVAQDARSIRRFAFIVGKNDGGTGRSKLKYAASDAQAFARVMEEMGGIEPRDTVVLLNPQRSEFLSRIREVKKLLSSGKIKGVRNELFLYYSGHSDEESLLLGGDRLSYRELKREIAAISADLSVVILDSCASGSFTQIKGGKRKAPFLEDSLSRLKGYVVLTSSSEKEAAQESDRVKGSFFTHYLLSGVRGAADSNADSRVTLNEAYHYAFHQTLARTEKTLSGPQHPSYSIELAGSGELVMTDIRNTNSRIVFEEKLLGRFYIRDTQEKLVAEVDKSSAKPIALGLEPGRYSINLSKNGKITVASATLNANHAVRLTTADFTSVDSEAAVARGDADDSTVDEEGFIPVPAEFSVMPDVSTNIFDQNLTVNNFHLSLFHARSAKVNGATLTLLGYSRVRKSVDGFQFSPGANFIDDGTLRGTQVAAGYNSVRDMTGFQLGAYNRAENARGMQNGLVNVTQNMEGTQLGAGNFIHHKFNGAQMGGLNHAQNGFDGGQLGIWNESHAPLRGVQLGGVNTSKATSGLQLGLVNIAEELEGLQIGLFNKSKGKKAVPIGIINLAEDGMARLGYSYGNSFHELQFRHGSQTTYSIFQGGYAPKDDFIPAMRSLGFGLGWQWTSPIDPLSIGVEGVLNWVKALNMTPGPVSTSYSLNIFSGLITQVKLLPAWRMNRLISLSGGMTWNKMTYAWGATPSPYTQSWLGSQFGIELWL